MVDSDNPDIGMLVTSIGVILAIIGFILFLIFAVVNPSVHRQYANSNSKSLCCSRIHYFRSYSNTHWSFYFKKIVTKL